MISDTPRETYKKMWKTQGFLIEKKYKYYKWSVLYIYISLRDYILWSYGVRLDPMENTTAVEIRTNHITDI